MAKTFRGDLINHVVGTLGCEREFAEDAVHAVERGITELSTSSDMLILKGFGTFSMRYRKPSVTRNPRTGAEMEVPASLRLGFKGAKTDGDS